MAHLYGQSSEYLRSLKKKAIKRCVFVFVLIELTAVFGLRQTAWVLRPISSVWLFFLLLGWTLAGLAILVFLLWQWLSQESTWLANVLVGVRGERRVYDILRQLPDTYSVFWGAQLQNTWDIDFIVVGPTGVFTVEVKSQSGRIGFNGKYLTYYGQRLLGKDILWQAMSQSVHVHEYLLQKTQLNVFVTPVLVFSSKSVGMRFGLKKVRGVYVIKKDWLIDLITKHSAVDSVNVPLIEKTLLGLLLEDRFVKVEALSHRT